MLKAVTILRLSNSNARKDDDVPRKVAPANLVPAAAVIREGQALFGMIGRKEHVDCLENQRKKLQSSTLTFFF